MSLLLLNMTSCRPYLANLIPNATDCQDYIQTSLKKDVADRSDQNKEKTGVNTGLFARHPITNEHVPLFIADYVLTDYGTGAVMAVPAHDTRDHAFAKKYNLPIIQVIESASGDENVMTEAYTDDGILIQSGEFTGLANNDAKTAITNHLNRINKRSPRTPVQIKGLVNLTTTLLGHLHSNCL